MKRNSDAIDIARLVDILESTDEKLSITSAEEIAALQKVVSDEPDLQDGLKRVVDCPGVFANISI
jgi:hypothetical protein